MNSCLNCGKEVKNKYCNVSCQNTHQGGDRANKKFGEFKLFTVKCSCCGKDKIVKEREKLFPQEEKYYCNRSCANSRAHSEETKAKISISLGGTGIKKEKKSIVKHMVELVCKNCEKAFSIQFYKRNQKTCSKKCCYEYKTKNYTSYIKKYSSKGGLASVKAQSETRRSKNEIYFSELCKILFTDVLTNVSMFNGWDADVILPNYKIAVLWNGKWHYEKITKKHSVLQVQNRDKIKTKEIIKAGYIPFVIKDMGKHNKLFVEQEFEKFVDFVYQISLFNFYS